MPRPVTGGTDRLRQHLAVLVGTRQATKIRSLTRADAGDEKRHSGLLRLHICSRVQRQGRNRRYQEQACEILHGRSPIGCWTPVGL